MMIKKKDKNKEQVQFVSMDELVPEDHILRDIDRAIDLSFIYDLVEDKYSKDKGRPSLDPVMLIKIPLIQYLFGIRSMRQTIKEIEVNVAYRWYLGLDWYDTVPHFSTFSKNYTRRFKDTDLFEQIFSKILEECIKHNFVDPSEVFVDATHIKASANKNKSVKAKVKQESLFYEEELKKEINKDREKHDKKPFKDKDDDDNDNTGSANKANSKMKTVKKSTTDPESGLFHKGEHKQVFAYTAQTACDKNGWILGYTIHPGNDHDSRTFIDIFNKINSKFNIKTFVADSAYKTPPIAKKLIDQGIKPIFPYKRPYTKKGFFRKYEYVYDEYYDCYICPNNQILKYTTTNRDGYREYKSDNKICSTCPHIKKCTHSKNKVKVVSRHLWEDYIEKCEDIRHTRGSKEIYEKRKETIERIFGTAKEHHGLRYTQNVGKQKMAMKVGLTFACLNLKKLANMMKKKGLLGPVDSSFIKNLMNLIQNIKNKRQKALCIAI